MRKKEHIRSRILACLLAAAMIIGDFPAAALRVRAAEEAQTAADLSAQGGSEEAESAPKTEAESKTESAESEAAGTQAASETETSESETTETAAKIQESSTEPAESEEPSGLENAGAGNISFTSISVKESGYQKAKIVWTISNPNNEEISTGSFNVQASTDGINYQTLSFSSTSVYQDYDSDTYEDIPNTYCVVVAPDYDNDGTYNITGITHARIELKNAAEPVYSDAVALNRKDSSNVQLAVNERIGAGVFEADLKVTPAYEADEGYFANLFYKEASALAWEKLSVGLYSYDGSEKSLSAAFSLKNLKENTEYQYYISVFERSYGSEASPKTFTTKALTSYTDDDFPDPVFRAFIRKTLFTQDNGQAITSADLEGLTELRGSREYGSDYGITGNIADIKGIELMPNLTSINFNGHTITDASPISDLTQLTWIEFEHNDLTELPDMSKMTKLSTVRFDDNKIAESSIAENKLPDGFFNKNPDNSAWIEDTKNAQRGEVEYKLAPEYYAAGTGSGTKRPFLIKVTGLKNYSNGKYTLSLTIGGKTVSASGLSCNRQDYMYCIPDIASTGIAVTEGTACQAKIEMKDSYGSKWLEKDAELMFAAGKDTPFAETSYISPLAKECALNIKGIPSNIAQRDIMGIVLQDSGKNKVGEADLTSLSLYENGNPYKDVFGDFYIYGVALSGSKMLSVGEMELLKYLTPGKYSAVLTLKDGTAQKDYELPEAVVVLDTARAYLYELAEADSGDSGASYDQSGDYWYVKLSGANIDPAKVWPVFYEGGEDITEIADRLRIYDYDSWNIIYKLKKLKKDTCWSKSGLKAFRIVKAEGYEAIDNIAEKKAYYTAASAREDFVLYEYIADYDSSRSLKVKLDARIADNTEITAELMQNPSFGGSETPSVLATAKDTLKKGWLSLSFTNNYGSPYSLSRSGNYLFRYSYKDGAGKTQTFNHEAFYITDIGFPSDYSSGGYIDGNEAHKKPVKKLTVDIELGSDTYGSKAEIYRYENGYDKFVDNAGLAKKGSFTNGIQKYTLTWEGSQELEEAFYDVKQDGITLYSFYVYDGEKFYIQEQSMHKWTDDNGKVQGLEVRLSSDDMAAAYYKSYKEKVTDADALKYWKNNKYKLEVFDRFKKPVGGAEVAGASWSKYAFSIKIKGLPANVAGYYIKITRDGKEPSFLGAQFYEDDSEYKQYYYRIWIDGSSIGEWHGIEDMICCRQIWEGEPDKEVCYGIESNSLAAYPLTVTLTLPYDITPAAKFTAQKPTSPKVYPEDTGREYYFTADDLKDIDPDTIYQIRVMDRDGKVLYNDGTGYFGYNRNGSPSMPFNPITITGIEGTTGADPEYYLEMSDDSYPKTVSLTATLTGATKLTAASSDTKVIAAGSTSVNGCTQTIPLTIKSAGAAEITLTANDAKNTKKIIWLYVTNATPLISTDLLTVNLKQTAGPRFFIYPHNGYTVLSAAFDDSSKFNLKRMDGFNGMCWVAMPNKDADGKNIAIAKQTYDLKIKGKVEKGGTEFDFALPIKIKAVDTAPKYKISQSEKINLFFKDGRALLNVSSNVPLGSIELPEAGCGFKVEKEADTKGTVRYYLKAKEEEITTEEKIQTLLKRGKTIKFKITFSGYEPIDNIDYTVNAEYKIPKLALSSKSATFYKNANSAVISVMNGKEKFALPDGTEIECFNKDKTAKVEGFTAKVQKESILIENIDPKNTGSFPMQIKLTNGRWSAPWYLPYTATVKDTDEPAVKLSKATLKLNADESVRGNDIATTELIWKDGVRFNVGSFECTGKDIKAQGVRDQIDITYKNDIITAKLKDNVDKGTYKFNAALAFEGNDGMPVKDKDGKPITVAIPLSIAVSDDAPGDAVKLSQKGAIDVLNREGTYIAVTPALKSINGTVARAALSDAATGSTDAANFTALVDNEGKIRIQVKKDAADLALNKDYIFNLSLTVKNADGAETTVTPRTPVKFKLKQGKPKVALSPTGATFFSGKEISLERDVAVTLAGAQNPPEIAGMQLDDPKNSLPFTIKYENGILTITSDKKAKAKTYKLPFIVTFKDQVGSEGIVKASYSVKVK